LAKADETPLDDRRLHALSEAMRAFAEATTDYERLLATVAERTCALVADGAFVTVVSDDRTMLTPGATCFRDPAAQEVALRFATAGPVHVDGPSVGARVARTRAPLRVPEVDLEALARAGAPQHAALIRELDVRSFLIVPLELRDRVLGVLSLARVGPEARPFNENDEAFARNLAEHAALAISNAQLLQSVQRELEKRRRAEEAVDRYGSLIENSGEFIAMASLEGQILFINRGGRELLGLPPDVDLGRLRLSDFHTEEGMKRGPIIREKGRWQGRGQLRHWKTGELIDTQVSSFLVRDAAGRPSCYATVQHDVRETKQLEAQLRQAQKMEALATLAGGIAHDFNNILSAILGNLELARMDVDRGSPPHAHMDEIASAGTRAVALVRQLLTLGRERESTKRVIRLADVVAEAVALLRSTIPARVELVAVIAPDTPVVSADPTQMHQIVMNLCTNAWHALGERSGRIVIDVAGVAGADVAGPDGPARWARLRVSDDGHGMDAATMERIFDPFFTTKAPGEGTGLGLAVVHGLVKDHLGSIRVDSAPGRGATFEILLPGVEGEAAASPVAAAPRAHGAGRRLLYLDDQDALVRSTEELLRRSGYDVRGFTQAHDLFEALRRNPSATDVVLTDYNMPRLSGLDVARVIRDIRPDLPVILLSGNVPDRLRDEAASAGIVQVIHKPFSLAELCEAIELHAAPAQKS
jgi:PAS domain S-box-containing protein